MMTEQKASGWQEEQENPYARLTNKELAKLILRKCLIEWTMNQFPKVDDEEDSDRFIAIDTKERTSPNIGKLSSRVIMPARHFPIVVAGRRITKPGFIIVVTALIIITVIIRVATS